LFRHGVYFNIGNLSQSRFRQLKHDLTISRTRRNKWI